MRKRLHILLVPVAICIAACYSQVTYAQELPGKTNNYSESTWQLLTFPEQSRTGVKLPILHFNFRDHRVTGNTGCNNFAGTFNHSDQALSFNKDFTITKMVCKSMNERAFFNGLFRTNRYELRGDTLLLKSNNSPIYYWKRIQ